jgi:hypothetical protein
MASKNSSTTISDLLSRRIAGIKKYLTDPNVVIPVGGKQCHPADVQAIFQADVDARTAVDTAHATVTSAIADRKTADAERRTADSALKSYVVHLWGPTSIEAQEFGYPPPKPRTKTVATKQAAIEKAAATRAARGTKGSVARTEVSGTTLVYSSPEAAAAAAAHSVAPAAGAPVAKSAPAGEATPPAASPAVTPAVVPVVTPAVTPAGNGASNGAGGASH